MASSQLEGRVFSRLQQFAALPEELQTEVKNLEAFLTEHQNDVFATHHANLVKTLRSARAKALLDKIDAWLTPAEAPAPEAEAPPTETAEAPAAEAPAAEAPAAEAPAAEAPAAEAPAAEAPAAEAPAAEAPAAEAPAAEAPAAEAPAAEAPAAEPAASTEATEGAEAAPAVEAAAAPVPVVDEAAKRRAHAKKLFEALVLHGFITPYKEHEKLPTAANLTAPLVYKDNELFVPLAEEVTEIKGLTVWKLVDGAVYAGILKRKAGFLAPLTQGKDTYVVVNERLKSVTLFDTDVGRAPIAHFEASAGVFVSFDKYHFTHGIKLWNETAAELINATTKVEREAIVHSLIKLGLKYREDVTVDLTKISSIYELKDKDIDGNEVSFDQFKGKVLLIVNVSSECGLTPINYPELATLQNKFKEQGLEVLLFPCNQFGGQEPGTDEEIKAFIAKYEAPFTVFTKGDVNGPDARHVFRFLKDKTANTEDDSSQYISWNFAKFLVDRNGHPVKRFGPSEAPLSFEAEIVTQVFKQAEPDIATAEKGSEETATSETAEAEKKIEEAPAAPAEPATKSVTTTVTTAEAEAETTSSHSETVVTETVKVLSMDTAPEQPSNQEEETKPAEPAPQTKVEELNTEAPQTKVTEVSSQAP